jgi:hypothetical protein
VFARLFTFPENTFDPAVDNQGPAALCDFNIVFPFVADHCVPFHATARTFHPIESLTETHPDASEL